MDTSWDTSWIEIGDADLRVLVAPEHGGRIAQVIAKGIELLAAPELADPLRWGLYPMVPWPGRIRDGKFCFDGVEYQLPANAPDVTHHALHGFGYSSQWELTEHQPRRVALRLDLSPIAEWPFGGVATQRFSVKQDRVDIELAITATERAMPAALGWHPWFRKPTSFNFRPTAMYYRDADWITVPEVVAIRPQPWDDCFINTEPVVLNLDDGTDSRRGVTVTVVSPCDTWVVFTEPANAICIEPQTAAPNAFNGGDVRLEAGETLTATMSITATVATM